MRDAVEEVRRAIKRVNHPARLGRITFDLARLFSSAEVAMMGTANRLAATA